MQNGSLYSIYFSNMQEWQPMLVRNLPRSHATIFIKNS